ncbi:hypothetical protein [Pedobacter arcticus]|uniref:hypothetical protein n=1 Tax=Pedobacter arcticus TaxID=752140 RepID=UPI0002EB7817|nr:hypothetical protein [Pedobacter arcticus]
MKKEVKKIDFKLQQIKTEQFAILEDNYNPKNETSLATSVSFRLDQETMQVGVFADFTFSQAKKIFIKIEVSCHFEIPNHSWEQFKHAQKQGLQIPKDFLSHLLIITVGTTRGVLFAKTENTRFNKFIIPSLKIDEIITEDAFFD